MGYLFCSLGVLVMLGMSIKGVKRPDLLGGTGKRQLAAADGALDHDLAAEAVELGRAAAGGGGDSAGLLDQSLLVDQAAEVLLVQRPAGQRLNTALQLQEG